MAEVSTANASFGTLANVGSLKVTPAHLKRDAFLYIRQSTLRQVLQNTESTQRQYALQQRAVALGWTMDQVHIIDCDLGQSGASTVDREGFQQLVAEVSLGHAGVVLGLEVSRLARNSADWQRLLELCAITDTLILDEDGLYDCNNFNDRLLLGLKGTLSEAKLHFLRARMRGGLLNKARRGELASPLPVGLIYDEQKRVRLDPDQQVQQAIHLVFETFRRTGSAFSVVTYFKRAGLHFPSRERSGARKGELTWGSLTSSRVLRILHNPRYAGAFFFGRTRTRTWPDGSHHTQILPNHEWLVLIPNLHVGYISWEEFQANQERIRNNAQAHGADRRKSPPREGPALLQGLVICGVCGRRMTIRYHARQETLYPDYICQREKIDHAAPLCQQIPGHPIDSAVTSLLLESMTPINLETALSVQQEIVTRHEEANKLRSQQVARAQYEADLAAQRYRSVDPNNRLVASTLEAEWNAALYSLQEAQREYESHRQADHLVIDDEVRAQIMALATDFSRVWNDPHTTDQNRKRFVRLLVEDVTLIRSNEIVIQVRFRGGATQTLMIPPPRRSWQTWTTPQERVQIVDHLLNDYTDEQVAAILNERGLHPGKGGVFRGRLIGNIRRSYGLKNHYERLREAGMLTAREMASRLAVQERTVKEWHKVGLLRGYLANDKEVYLFEPPGPNAPTKCLGQKLSKRRQILEAKNLPDRTKEVQYEA